jgi:HK97 gp10 family phage protein
MGIDRKSIVITGLKQVDKRLRTLEPRVQKKVIRQAMRKGLKVLAAAVKAEAPVLTGTMRDNVKVRAVKSRRRGSIQLEVRIEANDETKHTSPKTGKTVFYAAVVQYGPDPFMERAFDSAGERARQVALKALLGGIEREARASAGGGGSGKSSPAKSSLGRDAQGRFISVPSE